VGSRALKFSIQKRSRPAETEIFEYIYEIAKKISTTTLQREHNNECGHNLIRVAHKVSDHHLHHK
jgi:hypothetical protein